ncbi:MAG: DUF4157 domain-containing protein [Chloroflexota bacterium]|nr:DUF4157 domain-containing protein [Chloroflexota bacterium]
MPVESQHDHHQNDAVHQKPQPVEKNLQDFGEHAQAVVDPAVSLQRAMAAPPPAVNPNDILALQRTVGNQAVQRLVAQRKRAVFTSQPVTRAKPTPNSPEEDYEQEIGNGEFREIPRISSSQGAGAYRQVEEEEEELQAKPLPFAQRSAVDAVPEVDTELEGKINAAKGSGQSLTEDIRVPMEQAFDADFSDVRVHEGSEADKMAQSLQARAFTTGRDIFFRSGEYQPKSSSGQKLIAHELTHAEQQGASNRVARWWSSGHSDATKKASEKLPGNIKYEAKTIKFLADRSGDLDQTRQSWLNFALNIPKSGKRQKKWSKMPPGEEKKRLWDDTWFHVRDPRELPRHGEAGGYKGGKPGVVTGREKNIQHVNDFTSQAAEHYRAGNIKDGLVALSFALHAAEDRGAHGEGAPFTGHDPRVQKIKTLPSGRPNPHYDPYWDPDDTSINAKGFDKAVACAKDVLIAFYSQVNTDWLNVGGEYVEIKYPSSIKTTTRRPFSNPIWLQNIYMRYNKRWSGRLIGGLLESKWEGGRSEAKKTANIKKEVGKLHKKMGKMYKKEAKLLKQIASLKEKQQGKQKELDDIRKARSELQALADALDSKRPGGIPAGLAGE